MSTNGMDPTLASIYGTGEAEKVASAEMEGGDELSADELEELAVEALSDIAQDEGYEDDDEQEKTAGQEDFEAADYAGRIMAHSFHQELNEIEKTAASGYSSEVKAVRRQRKYALMADHGTKGSADQDAHFNKLNRRLEGVRGQQARNHMTRGQRLSSFARPVTSRMEKAGDRLGKAVAGKGKATSYRARVGKAISRNPKAAVGGLAAAGAGAAAGAYHKLKKSSALDTLVEIRANEILESGQYLPEHENDFSATVENLALELLQDNGYDVE